MKLSVNNYNQPTPVWFRKLKRAVSLTVTFGCALLLALGYTDQSLALIIIKLSESFLMNMLDILAGEDV